MGYLTAKQFAEKWRISERRIIKLCKEERISGAIKNGMVWLIPEDTIKPSDKRSNISKYINTEKRVLIVESKKFEISYLEELLEKQGYIIDKISKENLKEAIINGERYYDGLIFVDINDKEKSINISQKEFFIKEFSKKLNCESSIVLVNDVENSKYKLERKLKEELYNKIGLKINSLNLTIDINRNDVLINLEQISEDILNLFIGFKNTSGISIETDGGIIEFDKNGKSKEFEVGPFYKVINTYFKSLNRNSYMWCASTMLEDEWTEEPAEMHFRVSNLDAANRGANIERIFIFSKSKIKQFKNNKTLKIYMQSNIHTMFVDYDEILEKDPELLKIVGSGWDGINKETLILDLPDGNIGRGYVSINKSEVLKAYDCFQKLKTYAKELKEVLK